MSFVASLLVAVATTAASVVSYVPPVDAPVVDGFRPPPGRYSAGNRGIDFDTAPGDGVHAAADGVVVFAGRIGDSSHVVVLHDDGVRTSYSFLDDTSTRRGQRVHQGDEVGTARDAVHFGARVGDEYVDPAMLFGDGPPRVHLVPADLRHPLTAAQERRNLLDGLAAIPSAIAGGARALLSPVGRIAADVGWDLTHRALLVAGEQWSRIDEGLRAWAHAANAPLTHAERIAARTRRVTEDQRDCTPASAPTPTRPASGRIAVLVAGLGSEGGGGAILDVDTRSLGYADGMVTQASYTGGQAPNAPERTIAGIDVNDYGPADTRTDLRTAGAHLRRLLQDIARIHPGVEVDLLAHSQGGIVVRAALTGADTFDPTMPVIANVVTLGTPHHGAIAATAGTAAGTHPAVGLLFDVGDDHLGTPTGRSMTQLSSSSRLIDELGGRGLPAGTNVTSIAAAGDLVVDAQMSAIDHATNVVVPIMGITAHDRLPGDDTTHRELALALVGAGPTCRDGGLALVDAISLANGVRWVSDRLATLVHSSAAPEGTGPPG